MSLQCPCGGDSFLDISNAGRLGFLY
jgi:hypothetical protein